MRGLFLAHTHTHIHTHTLSISFCGNWHLENSNPSTTTGSLPGGRGVGGKEEAACF